jgi:carbon-monoxide dehydrogenase iron sulfur subunit
MLLGSLFMVYFYCHRDQKDPEGRFPVVRLRFDPGLCIGCHLCELACSALKHGAFSPHRARMRIISEYDGKGGLKTEVEYCDNCQKCVEACPSEALHLQDGYLAIDSDLWTQCGLCVEECPRGVIKDLENYGIAICDMCFGDPQCAKWCPVGAIAYTQEDASWAEGGGRVG